MIFLESFAFRKRSLKPWYFEWDLKKILDVFCDLKKNLDVLSIHLTMLFYCHMDNHINLVGAVTSEGKKHQFFGS